MVVVVAEEQAEGLTQLLESTGETVFRIGRVNAETGVKYSGKLL